MATSCGSDTVVEEDLAEFFELLDEDFFNNDEFSNSCLESIVDDAAKVENVIKCDQCEKTYKSKQGLSRHKNSKRPTIKKDKLHPATYKKFVNDAARKLSQDNCYSNDTKQQLSSFEWTLDQAIESFQHIKILRLSLQITMGMLKNSILCFSIFTAPNLCSQVFQGNVEESLAFMFQVTLYLIYIHRCHLFHLLPVAVAVRHLLHPKLSDLLKRKRTLFFI